MYCQACGTQNSDAARFCNMCGVRIAAPGTPGGPLADQLPPAAEESPQMATPAPATAPEPLEPPMGYMPSAMGASSTNVSLQGIGVRSPSRAWVLLSVGAVTLVALGAAGAWLAAGSGEADAAAGTSSSGNAAPDDPFVIGMPLGAETPDVDFVAGAADRQPEDPSSSGSVQGGAGSGEGTSGEGGGSARARREPPPRTTVGFGSGGSGGSGGSDGSGGSGGGASAGGQSSGQGGSSGGASAGGGSGSGTGEGSSQAGSGGSSGAAESGGSGGGAVPEGGEVPEDRDIAAELYGARVRYVIGRYYGSRAQTCFGRATRNNPNISGTVLVGLTIGADGAVKGARVVRNTTGDEQLGACLAAQVRSWRLPPPPDGEREMQVPFSR